MYRTQVRCLAVGLLIAYGSAVHTQQPATAAAQNEADVRAASAAEVDAFLRRDAATMARLWSDDFVVTVERNA